ncbi:probable cytochrome P450 4e1 [Drosophila novamexicana]|uniref:probable cytochrome P450 4e1 n=1 Tax=Drosophila novamexicana TaxID=47314 RepID=UPI0011E5AB16|nr:probable cytochrome P450 4e1 [Drosophila novamexicana]
MFEVVFLVAISAIFVLCWVLYGLRYERLVKHIDHQFAGPTSWPVVGNLSQMGISPDAHLRNLLKLYKQYNYKNFRIWIGPMPYVLFIECKYVEHVLSSTALTYKHDPYTLLYPWLGSGLLTGNGRHWAVRRKLITPSFHFRILKDFLHIINTTSNRFMKLLEQESDASKGQVMDMQRLVSRLTIDVICETAMGTRVNSIEGRPSPIVGAIDDLCNIIPERVFSVFKRMDWFFKFTSLYRQHQQALNTLHVEFAQIIEQRRRLIQTSNYQAAQSDDELLDAKRPKMAFLDNLITAKVDGKSLTFQDIFEEVSTFMFEGHDTTASAITFSIWCMARAPDVQQRAYEEQVCLYGNEKEREPTYEELQDMKYLDLVVKETLRLFPSVPFIFRTAREPSVILDKYLPQGTTIALPILAIGHSPHSFEEPFEFRPERFEATERTQANAFDNVPFSAGPRNCIGQKFALLELKVTLSKLLRRFRILPAPLAKQTIAQVFNANYKPGPQELNLHMPITLKSLTGVPVRLQRR